MSEQRHGPRAVLRPLGVADVLDGSIRLVRGEIRAVLALSLPFALVRAVLTALLQLAVFDDPGIRLVAQVGLLAVAVLTGTVLTGLLAPVFAGDLLGTRVSARQALARVGRRAPALVLLAVVVAVSEGAGLLALVAGGIWLWGVWALAAPAFALEGAGVRAALRRSFTLVRGDFWHVWGIRALGSLLVSVLGFFVTVLFDVLAAVATHTSFGHLTAVGHPGGYVLIAGVGGVVGASLLAPVASAIDVLLYTDRRVRREGMDIQLALDSRRRVVASSTTARASAVSW